jgi:linearmycin/streptolysin S transport system permease protein
VKAFAIAATDLRRLMRWRANIFFLFILPMLLILLLGAAFGGGSQARIGLVGGQQGRLAQQFVSALDARPSTELERYDDRAALNRAVARGDVDVGLVIPADYDARLRSGGRAVIAYLGRPDETSQQLRATIESVAAERSRALAAAQVVAREKGTSFAAALARAEAVAARVPPVGVQVTNPDGGAYAAATSRFENGASTQLLLFVFLNSLNGAVWLIETRRLGIARRMLSTPTSTGTILAGQVLGRLTVGVLQALIIVLGSLLFFGVDWGDPAGTTAIVLSFALVGTGGAVLIGSLFSSEQQAGPVALLLGLGLAALGGSMAPLEVFPDTARTIAHITPHAWANDAFSKLLVDGDGLGAVLPQVGVLLVFAAVALGLATWRLRRVITS